MLAQVFDTCMPYCCIKTQAQSNAEKYWTDTYFITNSEIWIVHYKPNYLVFLLKTLYIFGMLNCIIINICIISVTILQTCTSQETCIIKYHLHQAPVWVSEWLLFNAKWAVFHLYHDENKILFDDMMIFILLEEYAKQKF